MPAVASRGRGRRTISEINMVPFIDVMLVLLIIFMVTAPLITTGAVDLPSVGTTAKPAQVRFVEVVVAADGAAKVRFQGQESGGVRADGVADAVRRFAPDAFDAAQRDEATAVVISGDKSVRYEEIVKTLGALRKAGAQRVSLLVKTTP